MTIPAYVIPPLGGHVIDGSNPPLSADRARALSEVIESLRRLVTSVDVDVAGTHERVRVWNRGAFAGDLTVCLGDGRLIASILMGGDDHAG